MLFHTNLHIGTPHSSEFKSNGHDASHINLKLIAVSPTSCDTAWDAHKASHHYDDVIMTMLASQITSLPVVCSIVYSDVNQRKHQSSASLAFVREIHRGPVNFPHKWPVTRKMFPFDDVIMFHQSLDCFFNMLNGVIILLRQWFDIPAFGRKNLSVTNGFPRTKGLLCRTRFLSQASWLWVMFGLGCTSPASCEFLWVTSYTRYFISQAIRLFVHRLIRLPSKTP